MAFVNLNAKHEHAREASKCFLRAAAALTEPLTGDVLAFALLEGAIGLWELVQADGITGVAGERVLQMLRRERDARGEADGG